MMRLLILLIALVFTTRHVLFIWVVPHLLSVTSPVKQHQPIQWTASQGTTQETCPPNIILVVADDLGFNDISTPEHMGWVETPHLHKFAEQGTEYQAYAAHPMCAASRAAIMTGHSGYEFGFEFTPMPPVMDQVLPFFNRQPYAKTGLKFHTRRQSSTLDPDLRGLPLEAITIPEMLKEYDSYHIGKWHLGRGPLLPVNQGFKESLLMTSGLLHAADAPEAVNVKHDSLQDKLIWSAMQYAVQWANATHNLGPFEPSGYLSDYFTDEAVKVMKAHETGNCNPYFLYLAHWDVHSPYQADKKYYRPGEYSTHAEDIYAAKVRAIDASVGRLTEAMGENTYMFFTSDNGGASGAYIPHLNSPYRGWKMTMFEGGLRIPLMVSPPLPFGNTSHIVSHHDFFATFVHLALSSPPKPVLVPEVPKGSIILGTAPHETFIWKQGANSAIREKEMKLISTSNQLWLFNLTADPLEAHNLKDTYPDLRQDLQKKLGNVKHPAPLWDWTVRVPILIDKDDSQHIEQGDEFIYFQN